MNKQLITRLTMYLLVAYAAGVSFYVIVSKIESFNLSEFSSDIIVTRSSKAQDIKPFSSERDFKNYLAKTAGAASALSGFGRGGGAIMKSLDMEVSAPSASDGVGGSANQGVPADRVSGTNVQVSGIDEPDIVKTDGENIYVSNENFYRYFYGEPVMMEKQSVMVDVGRIMPPQYNNQQTKIVKALPVKDLKKIGEIEKNGNLLISGKNLVVFSPRDITGYDITDPTKPSEKWVVKIQNNSETAGVRLYGNKIYLIVKNQINSYHPCPIEPLMIGDKPVSIGCDRIYHPAEITPTDITYSAMIINPGSGEVEKSISFVGSSGSSVMHMSAEAIYMTYSFPGNLVKFSYDFFKANAGLVPDSLMAKIGKLDEYDLSYYTKTNELSVIVDQYRNSLSDDERLKFDNELNNKMNDYLGAHKRDLEKTGIVKIGVDDFKVAGVGIIPGALLNQFSMDEYNGHLRVAATVGQFGFWMFGFNGRDQSANDVYVLNKNMATVGSVKDLGKGERIYSVRFIEDKGYVVTFKQVDPFYVLDLSDPKQPVVKGELKIPGFSSYLHPLAKNIILGVGQENGQVKLSLFDVAKAENPVEISKYNLSEYWTEVSNNHHAFLQDAKHKVFFIPGGQGSYVFSYENNNLTLVKAVVGLQANRALYINDNLYVVWQDKITVLDEKTWEKAGEIDLK